MCKFTFKVTHTHVLIHAHTLSGVRIIIIIMCDLHTGRQKASSYWLSADQGKGYVYSFNSNNILKV